MLTFRQSEEDAVTVAPARRRGLAVEVADNLRDAIFSGTYAPGAALREVELSAALQVSRGPVREALLLLEREGLVRSEWHRGTTVAALSEADVAELHSLRGALEELAVRLVVGGDLSGIDRAVTAMARAETAHDMVRCDIAFHDAVYQAAGHSRLTVAWQAIRSQVYLLLLTRIGVDTKDYLTHLPAEHRALVDALRSRDVDAAVALFAVHREHAMGVLGVGHHGSRDRHT
jgi:DNA-binding GntR family transcriptional regulator